MVLSRSVHSETIARISGSASGHRLAPRGASSQRRRPRLHSVPLDADVDLLAPVDCTVREFPADAGVAAELRAVDVLDGELLFVGQFEEAA